MHPQPKPTLRASDADREHVVTVLREQVGTGRLTLDEFEQRTTTAYQARTMGELDALTRDLPGPTPHSAAAVAGPAFSPLLPVLVVLVLAVLVGGTLLALTGLDAMGSMHHMMGTMMGR